MIWIFIYKKDNQCPNVSKVNLVLRGQYFRDLVLYWQISLKKMIIKSSWYITNVILFIYDEWKNKLFHPNYIYIKCFSSLSSLSSRSLLINRYCSILLRTHWTWESDLQWNNHQVLMILALEDEKLQTTHQMERDEEDLVVFCCCSCGLRLAP